VWDDEIREKYNALSFDEQTFALEIIKGSKKGDAYKAAHPGVSDASKGACASAFLKRPKIIAFLECFRGNNLDSLFLIRARLQGIVSGEVIECEYNGTKTPLVPKISDINNAAAQLAKLEGLNAPEKVQDDRFNALVNLMNTRGKNGKEKA
jgi:hypothetical protein